MAKKKPAISGEFVLFNVTYEDGSQSSNRKVPADELGGLEGDSPARGIIEAQDRAIAEMRGVGRGAIKSIRRVGK